MNIAIIVAQYIALGIVLMYTLPVVSLYIRCVIHDSAPIIESKRQIAFMIALVTLYALGFPAPYHG